MGAFKSAIDHLHSRGLFDPLKQYITSGRPYFGICIGMQVLYQSSQENPDCQGLAIIPGTIGSFDNATKSVPHMGWNSVELLDPSQSPSQGLDNASRYYFVHSYRATYDLSNPDAAQWAYATTQYGQEVFVASVLKGNVFGTQFHPEKSGQAGLRILDSWLKQTDQQLSNLPSAHRVARPPRERDGFTKRIIACMDVRTNDDGDLVVTKGDQYDVREKVDSSTANVQTQSAGAVRNLGKPVALASKYYAEGADEICLLNITSFRHSPLHDQPMLAVVKTAAETVFVPLTIGGGIKDTVDPDGTRRPALEVAGEYFRAGADKVSIGSEAVITVEKMLSNGGKGDGTSAIETIAKAYGRQAVVVSIDPKRAYIEDVESYSGPHRDELVIGQGEELVKAWWYQCTISGGRQCRDLGAVQLARGVELLGAGEILVNSIDRDGTGRGFDLDLLNLIRKAVRIPVVASSGAGTSQHFVDVFEKTGVEAALAAGIFNREEVQLSSVKEALSTAGLQCRMTS